MKMRTNSLIFTILMCIFAVFSTAQEPACLPTHPDYQYTSTFQVSEDEYGIQHDYNLTQVFVTKDSVRLVSDYWDYSTPITEGWQLVPIRAKSNGVMVYEWQGRSPEAFYRIPVIYKQGKWLCGYLTEKLCVGVDYTVYRNNIAVSIRKHEDSTNVSNSIWDPLRQ